MRRCRMKCEGIWQGRKHSLYDAATPRVASAVILPGALAPVKALPLATGWPGLIALFEDAPIAGTTFRRAESPFAVKNLGVADGGILDVCTAIVVSLVLNK